MAIQFLLMKVHIWFYSVRFVRFWEIWKWKLLHTLSTPLTCTVCTISFWLISLALSEIQNGWHAIKIFTNIRIAFIIEIILRYYFPYFKLIISSKQKIHNWYYEKRANQKLSFFFTRKPDFWLHMKSQMISILVRLPWNYHYFALFFCCSVSLAWFCTRYDCKKKHEQKR